MLNEFAASIHGMQADDFWLLAIITMLLSLGSFWWWFRSLKRARLIEDTPTSKCRSAAQGYVELIGQQEMMPGEPIQAPLTGRRCTWWAFEIEEKRTTYSNGKSRTRWVTVESDTSGELFLVRDDTGECVIDPDHAEVHESAKDSWYGSTQRPANTPKTSSFFGGRYRYTERRMHVGDMLYAIGLFTTRNSHHAPLEKGRETAALLAQWKQDQHNLLQRFDADRDGSIDMQEWEQARKAAEAIIDQRARDRALQPDLNLMLQPPDGRPYILSTVPETELTKKFRWMAAGGLTGFLLFGAGATFMLIVRLGISTS